MLKLLKEKLAEALSLLGVIAGIVLGVFLLGRGRRKPEQQPELDAARQQIKDTKTQMAEAEKAKRESEIQAAYDKAIQESKAKAAAERERLADDPQALIDGFLKNKK